MKSTKQKQSNIALTILLIAIILIISSALSFLTVSLLGTEKKEKTEYTASQITSIVVKKMNYENLSEISASNISKYYDIPEGTVEDSSLYISTRSDNFTEIACFRLSSKDKEKQLTEVINNYIAEKTNTYKSIGGNAYSMISKSRTDIKYPYVFVAIAPDSEAAVNAFETIIDVDLTSKESENSE